MPQLTKQGVRDLNHLQPRRREEERPRDPCEVGLHKAGPWERTKDGYCKESRCVDCGEITGFEAYYGSR